MILWHSNAPWCPTGYGLQTNLMVRRLKEAGEQIAISAFYGLEGNMIGWKGVPILPGVGGTFGNESLPAHAAAFFGGANKGLVVTLMDVWVLHHETMAKMNVASWCPVDHDPLPPAVEAYFENSGAIPIAMSRFGETRLAAHDPLFVPHAVDTKAYKPLENAKEATGLPDSAFVCGLVAANKGNPSRKAFVQQLTAFKAFRERHDDAVLALHTELKPPNGLDLGAEVLRLGLEGAVHKSDQYATTYLPLTAEAMAAMFSSFDVTLHATMGEGFGVALIESQACGTPVIATDFSSMPELCGAGWLVESTPHLTGQMSWQVEPDIEDIVESLEEAYRMPEAGRKQVSERARTFALDYDADHVFKTYLQPALAEVQERIGEPVEVAA